MGKYQNITGWNSQHGLQYLSFFLPLQLKAMDANLLYTSNDLFRGTDGILEWTNK
jgi:hypothetical protein